MPQINIEQIKSFLDVERISITQKTTAYCFLKDPKQMEDKDFAKSKNYFLRIELNSNWLMKQKNG